MLEPSTRQVYLEQLMPPDGFTFDLALACTYSLDLITLLMTPLAMALYDVDGKDAALSQPLILAEAVRRAANKVMVFCHKGRIAVPTSRTTLYSYLEPMVIQARPPRGGSFHPKLWLLRFVHESGQVSYRFICLSRNMTFDRSWDVSVSLEGNVNHDRVRGYSGNRPLRDFVRVLPDLAVDGVSARVHSNIELMADEVGRVPEWAIPNGFEGLEFIPSGISGYSGLDLLEEPSRVFVMSPFLSDAVVSSLCEAGRENVLVSTHEALDDLSDRTFSSLAANTSIYTLSDWSMGEDEDSQSARGLHAKAYLMEDGGNAEFMVGSANATYRAFHGSNVEFMVRLYGRRHEVGIAKILGTEEKPSQLAALMQPYVRSQELEDVDNPAKELEATIEQVREALVGCDLSAVVTADVDDSFTLEVKNASGFELPADVVCTCRPVTVHPSMAADAESLVCGGSVKFSRLDTASLTSFIAFELTASSGGVHATAGFVLNLEVDGMPEDRNSVVLRNLIQDENSFISYVRMLLSDDLGAMIVETGGARTINRWGTGPVETRWTSTPLLEPLVRAYSREPEKIEHIQRLLDDLRCSTGEADIIPRAFAEFWSTLKEAAGTKETRS